MNEFIYQLEVALVNGILKSEQSQNLACGKYLNEIPMGLIGYKSPREAYREMKNKM